MFDWFGDDSENGEDTERAARKEEIGEILDEYEQRFDEELPSESGRVASRDYQAYREAEEIAQRRSWYEKMVSKLSLARFTFEDLEEEHRNAIRLLNWDIDPGQIAPAALLVAAVAGLVVAPLLFMDIPTIFKLFAGTLPFAALYYLVKYPSLQARRKVVSSSENLILAVLYMVVHMRSSPSLEGAVAFASRHLDGVIAKDLKLVLWRLDVREYATIDHALDDYVSRWEPYNRGFVQALNLVQSATEEASQQRRNEILTEAIDTLLESTQERMDEFARNLKMPVMALYGLGIMLPVLLVILFPMIAAFMGGSGLSLYLAVIYNVLLPLIVYAIMKNLLVSRPLSLSSQSGSLLEAARGKVSFEIGDTTYSISAFAISIPVFLLLAAWPAPHYYQAFIVGDGLSLSPPLLTFLREMMAVVAIGVPVGLHLYIGYRDVVENQVTVQQMEAEFPEVLFELSNALDRGKPVELAVADVAQKKRLDISEMFAVVAHNIRDRGMTFEEALFDADYGAMQEYPSKMMRTVMQVISESAQRGPGVAASAAGSISQYLQRIKETQQSMEELMEETLSSLSFLAYALAPVITGVAVGMGGVITLAFTAIDEVGSAAAANASAVNATGGSGLGSASFSSIFQVGNAVPPGILQLIVGVYLIQISILVGTLMVRLTDGENPSKRNTVVGKILLVSVPFYTLVTLILLSVFGGMIRGVT